MNASLSRLAVSSDMSWISCLLLGLSLTMAASASTIVDYTPALIYISITLSSFDGSLLSEVLCFKDDKGEVLSFYANNLWRLGVAML